MPSLGAQPQTHSVVGANSPRQARLKRQVDRAVTALLGLMGAALVLAWLATAMVRGQRTADAELLRGLAAVMPPPIGADPAYRILPGDCLVLSSGDEFVGEYLVDEDGNADFGPWGAAHLAGLTACEAQAVFASRLGGADPQKPFLLEISEFRQDACVVRLNLGPSPTLARLPFADVDRFFQALAKEIGPNRLDRVEIDVARSSGCRVDHFAIGLSGLADVDRPWPQPYGLRVHDIATISTRSLPDRLRDVWSLGVEGALDQLDGSFVIPNY